MNRCNMMIFGSTGDLTYRKLIPAIFDLYKAGMLCDTFLLVCIGRRDLDLETYLEGLDDDIKKQLEFFAFKEHMVYHQLDFSDAVAYQSLMNYDYTLDWIFYLATAPRFFASITKNLHDKHIFCETEGYKRVVFEKPFGKSLHDAKKINKEVSKYIDESQIYRIDHYLGKEMVQNILLTRTYNNIIEMLWHKDAISHFEIVIAESDGVHKRGGYYDQSGALKDMVQNHMFQIVALLAMPLPMSLIPEEISEEKARMLKKIEITNDIVLGQYEGYTSEALIPEESKTETFVALKLFVHDRRWKDVPFYLKTGKALKSKYAHIVVHFKKNHGNVDDNLLVIQVQPEEGIYLQMNSKKPGISTDVSKVTMDYCHSCLKYGDEPSAYGRLILDIILGDKSLFASWAEVESSWVAIDHIEKKREHLHLMAYPKNENWDGNILLEKGWWQHD